jgi:hypothetical protein
VVEVLPVPLELEAPPMAGFALEPLVSLLLPLVPLELEPVPVAPIELVLLEPGVDDVSLDAVPEPLVLPLPPRLAEPLPDGLVLELPVVVDELLAPVPLEPVVVPLRLQADSERAAVTATMAAVTWVRVIFIGKLLKSIREIREKRKGSRDCPELTLGRPYPRSVGTGSNRV